MKDICIRTTSDPGNLIRVQADEVPVPHYDGGGKFFLVFKSGNETVAIFDVSKLDGWWESK